MTEFPAFKPNAYSYLAEEDSDKNKKQKKRKSMKL